MTRPAGYTHDDWITCDQCLGSGEIGLGFHQECGKCGGEGGWPAVTTRWDDELHPEYNAMSEDEILFLSRSWDVPLPPQPSATHPLIFSAEDFLPLASETSHV